MRNILFVVLFLALTRPVSAQVEIQLDIICARRDGLALTYDLLLPPENIKNGGGVLLMVSGGWRSMWTDANTLLEKTNLMGVPVRGILASGYAVYIVRHGSVPRFEINDVLKDVRSAANHIQEHAAEHGIDPQRLAVTGLSSGGHLALMLATDGEVGDSARQPIVAAAIALAPPTDMAPIYERFSDQLSRNGLDEKQLRRISPRYRVDKNDAPVLLIHGDADSLVPLEHSTAMEAALREAGVDCEFTILEGAGHSLNFRNGPECLALILAFLDDRIGQAEPE